jgi:hypothetical protein
MPIMKGGPKAARTVPAPDAEEDKLYGCDKTGEELPNWVASIRRTGYAPGDGPAT